MKHLFFSVGLLCLMAAPISVSAQAQNTKDLLNPHCSHPLCNSLISNIRIF